MARLGLRRFSEWIRIHKVPNYGSNLPNLNLDPDPQRDNNDVKQCCGSGSSFKKTSWIRIQEVKKPRKCTSS